MIEVKKIKPFKCRAYSPEGIYLGMLNDFEFNDLRIQIAKEKAIGYYMIFNKRKICITQNGRCDGWPNGFYDTFENQLSELIHLI
jgi:predicted ATPase